MNNAIKSRPLVLSVLTAVLAVLVSCLSCGRTEAPNAKVKPKIASIFGVERIDNYYWLRERDNPEVIDYLEAENAYTEKLMKHTEGLQEKLFEEMVSRIQENDSTAPARSGDYLYYSRNAEDQAYEIYCRKKGGLQAEEEVILDLNQLAEGREFLRLGAFEISPDQNLLAYSIDETGGERYALYVKDLSGDSAYGEVIDNTYPKAAWAADNKTLFYMTRDEAWRPYRLYRHTLGTNPSEDKLIYEETDDGFWMSIGETRNRKYLLLQLSSETSGEVRYLRTDNPTGTFRVIEPRRKDIEYSVAQHGDEFYITTNEKALNFRVVSAPISNPSAKNWKDVFPYNPAVKIDTILAFRNYLAVFLREGGQTKIKVINMAGGKAHFIDFEEDVYSVRPGINHEFDTDTLRFQYESMRTPEITYDYAMDSREKILRKETKIPGDFNPDDYESRRVFAVAADGTRIPITMIYRKGVVQNGSNPLLLHGYGSYGISLDPGFSSNRISILDRGFIFAVAHVRGGGEMGRQWYEDGKLLNKKNTFTDFITCAKYLIDEHYTASDRLAIDGGSAGGLLIGAAVNMRPDLFKAAVADVPFVDIVNTMLDETIPLTVIEYEEWGNPNDSGYFDYMLSYSPYDNVTARDYPNMLVTAGLNDPRVQYWEPAKWTARLRATKTDDNILLLKTNMGAGHMGRTGRYERLRETAFEYAFILDMLGIKE